MWCGLPNSKLRLGSPSSCIEGCLLHNTEMKSSVKENNLK